MAKQIPTDRTVTYQLQLRSCGSRHCQRCKNGGKHGPYWYAYWHGDDGKLTSGYVGKKRPEKSQTLPDAL